MSDSAQPSRGITLEYSTDGGNTYDELGEVRDSEIGAKTSTVHDTDDHKAGAMTYVGGVVDEGEMNWQVNLLPDNAHHKAMRSNVGSKLDWRLTLPSAITADNQATFKGVLKGFGPVTLDKDGVIRADISVKISGTVTWATA